MLPVFFSSKCNLFHNANLFGSCIIHILYTGCAKIKKIIPAPKGEAFKAHQRSLDPSVDSESFVLYLEPYVALRRLLM